MATEGGTDYDISISGNFDDKITGFISSVKELTKEVKSLSKGTSEKTGKDSSGKKAASAT